MIVLSFVRAMLNIQLARLNNMKFLIPIIVFFNPYSLFSQVQSGKDSTAFLDSIYREMDAILDELVIAKSHFSVSLGAGTGFFNFKSTSSAAEGPQKKVLISPSAAYMHKSGISLSATAYAVAENEKLNAYQFSFTPSYDYIKRGRFSTGAAFTKYFTRQDLTFYTTPIANEAYVYFNYKKPFVQPAVSVAYGWGSRTSFEERKSELLRIRRQSDPLLMTIRNDESVKDLSLLLSVRHDFDWFGLFGKKDLFTLTPVILINSGTRNFGFNTSFQGPSKFTSNFLPGNQYVEDRSEFDTQSASLIIKGDYSTGIFFIQSQLLFDYFLHTADNRLKNAFALIAGVNF